MLKTLPSILLLLVLSSASGKWGFFAHKRINRLAVFTLPLEMIGFYKHNIQYITENAVNPDRRRYAVEGEAERHYIDLDVYGDSARFVVPHYWNEAVEKYSEDTLTARGIVPWHVNRVRYQLTDAMRIGDVRQILRLSADLGHYIADANVPLHTTANYDGQYTNQRGIHGLWESRLPELFADQFALFAGKAEYLKNPQTAVWEAVIEAHNALDSVFRFEILTTQKIKGDKKYAFETRGSVTVKVYSEEFSGHYHRALKGMVERRMLLAIKMVGDFWYTCWVDAGQPDLNRLIDFEFTREELQQRKQELKAWKIKQLKVRDHTN